MEEKVIYDYDASSDVLYLFVGEPRNTLNNHIDADVCIRLDVETGEVVGLTILGCKHAHPELLKLRGASKESIRAFLKIMTQAAPTIIEGQEYLREWRAQRDGQSKKAKVGVA
jgi:uncharacterized protein YuzE